MKRKIRIFPLKFAFLFIVHLYKCMLCICTVYTVQAQSYNGVQCTICRYNILTVYCNCTMYTNYAVKCSTYSLTTVNIVRSYNCAVTVYSLKTLNIVHCTVYSPKAVNIVNCTVYSITNVHIIQS